MRTVIFGGIFACAFLMSPVSVGAYETTKQSAKRMNETTAAYFITFAFGHKTQDMYLPVAAVRNQAWNTGTKSLGYEVLENAEFRAPHGTALAVVASNAKVVDGMYYVPKGVAAEFVLIVLYTTEADEHEATYAVQVTDLPFYMNSEKQQLNPSELQYYVTNAIRLNSSETARLQELLKNMKVEVKEITYTKR